MATYEKRTAKKDGHITYGIQIKVKDYLGRDKFVNTTWKNPNNLTGERLESRINFQVGLKTLSLY